MRFAYNYSENYSKCKLIQIRSITYVCNREMRILLKSNQWKTNKESLEKIEWFYIALTVSTNSLSRIAFTSSFV